MNDDFNSEDFPVATMRITCETPGCLNQGRVWEDELTFLYEGDGVLVFCGLCNQQTTNLEFA